VRTRSCGSVKPAEKRADPIYSTPEFKQWRTVVIRRAGNICQWPGCTRSERRMFADHIVEVKDGGALFDPANGQCLCGSHHSLKTVAERRKRAGIQE
jgi:nitrite reductase/ring-hydroxylating ferredoxin subunit